MKNKSNENKNIFTDSLMDHIQASIFLVNVDQDGTFRFEKINKAEEKATGLTNEMMKGKTPVEVFGEETGRIIEENYNRCLEAGHPISYEETIDMPIGKKTGLTKLSPVWSDGRIVQIVGASTDITEIKRNEKIQNKLYKKIEAGLQAGNLSWWEMDLPSGKIEYDDRKAELLGYSPDEFNHYEDFMKLVHPDDYDKTMQAMREHIKGDTDIYEVDYRIKNKTGEYRWFKDIGNIIERDKENGTLKIIGIVQDITKEQKMKERLEMAMDTGEHGFWDKNLDTGEIYCSPRFYTMLGYEPGEFEMTSDVWRALIHPEDRPFVPELPIYLEKFEQSEDHLRLKCKDGSYKWIASRAKGYERDGQGIPHRAVGVHVDIVELKRKTEALKESHRMAKMGRWDYYHKDDKLHWSEEILEIFELDSGKSDADYPTFMKWVHPDDRERVDTIWKNSLEKHLPYDVEHRLQMSDGRVKWVKEYCYTEYDQQNAPHRSIGIMQDITQQKTLELDLRKSEEKFRKLFQKHLAVQLLIDSQTKYILDANEAAIKYYGYTKTELKQMKITQINMLPPEEIRTKMKKALTNQQVYFQFKHKLATGELRDVEVFSNHLEIEGKKVIHAIVHDITEKKQNEEALIEAKHLAEAANIAKTEFLSTMSHELRTPLNGVIGFSEILKYTGLNNEQNEYLDTVLSSAKNLLAIISDILDYSIIDAKNFELHPEETDLRLLIRKANTIIQQKAVKKGLEFSVDIEEGLPKMVEVDSGKLRQVLLNLLSNAVKFTEKGSVHIQLKVVEKNVDNARILFKVTDTGIGIKEKYQEIIFKAFQQVDMSMTRKYGGTGLGLSISNNLLQKMDSTLNLKSKYGEGSTFSFELRLPYGQKKEKESVNPETEGLKKSLSIQDKTVLIVEDNPVNMRYAQKAIAMFYKGIQIIKAKDGKEAYKLFLEHNPDLILMDIIMPGIDGYQATRMIRDRDKQTPIVAMTAKAYSEDRAACLKAGMNDFITKPVTLNQLKEMVEKYLS